MPLAPPVILIWTHSVAYGREVGITCDLIDDDAPAYYVTATTGIGYRISSEDTAVLLRIITPATDALSHPLAPPTPRQSLASD